jgi:L-fuconolactonase
VWIDRLADAEPRIAGIVAFLDLLDEAHRDDALVRLADSRRVVGVRHNIQRQPPGFALQPAFVRGVRAVTETGRPFDLCITADQLAEVNALVELCPDTDFVLDHCGKPAIRDDAFVPWAGPIRELASHGGVHCKLSGLLTEARADQRTTAGVRRYAEHVIACFGAERLIYGTDWPVSTLGGGAELWRSITDELTSAWSEIQRRAFYSDNAMRFYGLEVAAHG